MTRAVVVVAQRARKYLEAEVIAPGGALDDLHKVLGPGVLPRRSLEIRSVLGPDGHPCRDEESEDYPAALGNALWTAAREATRRPEPVVFALAGGRNRVTTAAMTTVFTLLGRQRDRRLAAIIEKVNELFEGELTDQDRLVYVDTVIKAKLMESKILLEQAANNTKEQFAGSPDLHSELLSAVMAALDAHTTMSTQAINSSKVRAGLKDILLNYAGLWEALQAKSA